jgi:hypothetical protein
MLLSHQGRAVPLPIEALSDVPHFWVLIPSPASSTSGIHQFCCRIPPSRLVSRTTSLCPLDSPPQHSEGIQGIPRGVLQYGCSVQEAQPFEVGFFKWYIKCTFPRSAASCSASIYLGGISRCSEPVAPRKQPNGRQPSATAFFPCITSYTRSFRKDGRL